MEWNMVMIIIAVQVVTMLILALVLTKIVGSASAAELKRLRNLNLENQKKAEHLAKELEKAESDHQRRVQKAETELQELKQHAQEEAERHKTKVLEEARAEGDRIVNQAMKVKERIREEVESEMQEKSIALACRLIKGVLTAENMKWFHDGLVKDILEAVRGVDPETLAQVEEGTTAEVRTPYEMDDSQLHALQESLQSTAGKSINVNQVSDKDVIAGITIRMNSLVIDGSLSGRLHRVAASVQQET